MEIYYTNHARYQLNERKVEEVWVEDTVKYPDKLRVYGIKHYAVKRLNGKILMVVYTKERYIKITTIFWIK